MRESKVIVAVITIVGPAIVSIEPRLAVIAVNIEQVQIAVGIGQMHKTPPMPPPLE